MQSYQGLVELLELHGKERTRIRKKLIKFIRFNKHRFRGNAWLLRKMRLNYMGDLTDKQILNYCERILN